MPPLRLDSRKVLRSAALARFEWLEHGFGTAESVDWPGREVATVRQIHSDLLILADRNGGPLADADGLLGVTPGVTLAVRTADCVPILLVDPVQRVAGAIHAGWRGTVAGIAAKAVRFCETNWHSHPADLIAVLGPAIGPCCFEVGPEVAQQFESVFPERGNLQKRTHLDLGVANFRQLTQAGVPMAQIGRSELCTVCGGGLFHSWRRDEETSGRMVAAIGIRT